MTATLTLRYAARSDRGLVRDGNQDSVYAGPRLLVVADGMGGAVGGDVASALVVATMAALDADEPSGGEGADAALREVLRTAVDSSNQRIRDAVAADPDLQGMGTTLTALMLGHDRLGLVHVGDSRAYVLRDGALAQVTKDDTYVQMLLDDGKISDEDVRRHPWRSVLVKAMQGRPVTPTLAVLDVVVGDRYLLCSDGLSGVVAVEAIESTLRECADPQRCAERLVELALDGGGPDNITVVVADAAERDAAADEEQPIVGGAAAVVALPGAGDGAA